MIKDMPQVGLGTWYGSRDYTNEGMTEFIETSVEAAIKAGYKLIDTAQIYNNEFQIGNTLKKLGVDRGELFITSKVLGLNFKNHTYESVQQSLRRLQVGYVDLMLLHSPVRDDLELNAYKELMRAREDGLVKHIGVSNFSIAKLKNIHEATGEWPYVNQIVLTPSFRAQEIEDFCKEHGIKLTGYSIMKGYFNPNPFVPGMGMGEEGKAYIDSLAAKYNKDAGQILNKWALQIGYAIIPKSTKASRVVSNFDLNSFELTKEEEDKISAMNQTTSEIYSGLIAKWYEGTTEEALDKGLLFEDNFGNK